MEWYQTLGIGRRSQVKWFMVPLACLVPKRASHLIHFVTRSDRGLTETSLVMWEGRTPGRNCGPIGALGSFSHVEGVQRACQFGGRCRVGHGRHWPEAAPLKARSICGKSRDCADPKLNCVSMLNFELCAFQRCFNILRFWLSQNFDNKQKQWSTSCYAWNQALTIPHV